LWKDLEIYLINHRRKDRVEKETYFYDNWIIRIEMKYVLTLSALKVLYLNGMHFMYLFRRKGSSATVVLIL